MAQQEHDAFAQKLRDNGVEVLYLERLMADVIRDNRQVREQFIDQWLDEADIAAHITGAAAIKRNASIRTMPMRRR